jgi:aarF domain-containing kinase
MMDQTNRPQGLAVPSNRLNRLWHLGRATGDLAAGIGMRGLLEMAMNRGATTNRIRLSPEHTRRFTDRLAKMRGAVMKMGQLMSMDGSDVFTPEAAQIMATLRDRAAPMPLGQIHQVMTQELGPQWDKQFRRFDFTPVAAASIGQVHRAETRDGRHLALKVQFPGIRESIDSDIDNLAFLGRTFGVIPKGMDPVAMIDEARRQLHREADYGAEADSMEAYAALVGDDPDLLVPRVHRDLSTTRVLAMDFADGIPVDRLAERAYRHAERDRAATLLARLMMRELFEFGLVQTDPNFGNYLYNPQTGRIVLLDFGAVQPVAPSLTDHYRTMARAAIDGDRATLYRGAQALGYLAADAAPDQADALLGLMLMSGEPLRHQGPYDFGSSDLFERVFDRGRALFLADTFNQLPDPATLFLHRKFMGTFMLCRRLRAKVDLGGILAGYL